MRTSSTEAQEHKSARVQRFHQAPGVRAGAGEQQGTWAGKRSSRMQKGYGRRPLPSPSLYPGQRETDTHGTGTSNNQELRRLHKITNDLHRRERLPYRRFQLNIQDLHGREGYKRITIHAPETSKLGWFYCMRKSFDRINYLLRRKN